MQECWREKSKDKTVGLAWEVHLGSSKIQKMPFSFLHRFFSRAMDAEAKSSAAAGLCSCNYKPKFSWKMHNKCYLINILLSIKTSNVQQNLHTGDVLINDFLCFLGNNCGKEIKNGSNEDKRI